MPFLFLLFLIGEVGHTTSQHHIPVIGIVWRIGITQRGDDIRQSVVFPADENVAGTGVPLDDVGDTLGIVTVTGQVHGQTEVGGERLDGVVGTLTFAAFGGE